jgi:carboxymethylenebutenolidase
MLAEVLTVRTDGGLCRAFVCKPVTSGRVPGILLFPDAAGPRPSLLASAARIAARGFCVFMPDLYYRCAPYPELNIPEVFARGPEWLRMRTLRDSLTNADMRADTAAWLAFLQHSSQVMPDRLACIGLSFGGRFAIRAVGWFPELISLAISIQGGDLVTTDDDSPHKLISGFDGHIHIAAAETDPHCLPQQLKALCTVLESAEIRYSIEVYGGTRHGFVTIESAAFDPVASEHLWQDVERIIDRELA